MPVTIALVVFFLTFYLVAAFGPSRGKSPQCGHFFWTKGEVDIFGQRTKYKCTSLQEYCPNCRAKMSIRCAWCKSPICIDDPVTLYSPRPDSNYIIPKEAVEYHGGSGEKRFVGCLRWDCASTGADRQGFWVFPGKVRRVASAFEQLIMSSDEDPCVIINDTSDQSEAIDVEEVP